MKFLQQLVLVLFLISHSIVTASAGTFKVGETVFVAYPAANIKEDAFIIGLVTQALPEKKQYRIKVMDYVEGHDYGLSCVPMALDERGELSKDKGWELWTDTKKLTQNGLEYLVSAKDVLSLAQGQHRFITRNNVYINYSRWRSNAPMLSIDRLEIASNEARSVGLGALLPVFELAKKERQAYYEGNFGRPYWPHEVIDRLPMVLQAVIDELNQQPSLKKQWFAKQRDWQTINQDTYLFFMIDAIDKIVEDARYTLADADLSQTNPNSLTQVKALLKQLKR